MTESEWLTCADPVAMLDYLSHAGNRHECATERKLWLFVCAVQRAWWGEAPRRDLASITTLERMADADNVTRPGLENVHFTYTVPPDARDAALECVRVHNSRGDSKKWAAIIRDIVGNPFRPVELSLCEGCYGREDHGPSGNANWKRSECPCCGGVGRIAPWLTPAVLSLAQAAYDTRQPDGTLNPLRLAVLADALEDAGCEGDKCDACRDGYQTAGQSVYPCRRCMGSRTLDHPILAHLRTPGPHWRGCWAVDLILGKE